MTTNRPTVNTDWIKNARSPKARSEIRRWIRKQMQMHSIELGEEILVRALKRSKISTLKKDLDSAASLLQMESTDDLYAAVGSGKISSNTVIQKLLGERKRNTEPDPVQVTPGDLSVSTSARAISVGGMDNLMVNFGKCCLPIPGDPIVGYITRGKGVTIHRKTCRNVRQIRLEPEREIAVKWEQESDRLFTAGLKIALNHSANFIKNIVERSLTGHKLAITAPAPAYKNPRTKP